MQLKKCANHPYLFEGVEPLGLPHEEASRRLVEASGKLSLLLRMVARLRATGHRVLVFSQVPFSMSLIQDDPYAGHHRGRTPGGRL
jgi:SNF2 family DNA or RNA helicase